MAPRVLSPTPSEQGSIIDSSEGSRINTNTETRIPGEMEPENTTTRSPQGEQLPTTPNQHQQQSDTQTLLTPAKLTEEQRITNKITMDHMGNGGTESRDIQLRNTPPRLGNNYPRVGEGKTTIPTRDTTPFHTPPKKYSPTIPPPCTPRKRKPTPSSTTDKTDIANKHPRPNSPRRNGDRLESTNGAIKTDNNPTLLKGLPTDKKMDERGLGTSEDQPMEEAEY